ncbi:MAG: polyphosphate kinase 1 [Gammaproteobacteria bacterium]
MTAPMTQATTPLVLTSPAGDLEQPEYFSNRWASLFRFNLRVLEQATSERHPLLERLKFLMIFSSNMDEFFEIRMATLKKQIRTGEAKPGPDGLLPQELLNKIQLQVHEAIAREYSILNDVLMPKLAEENIHFVRRRHWSEAQREWIANYFREQVQPVLTPIGIDLAHPFPRVVNKSLNFIISLEGRDAFGRQLNLAIVPAPRSLPRIIRLPDHLQDNGGDNFVFLSSIIHDNAGHLFPGMKSTGCYQFRITRNADLTVDEHSVEDLPNALKTGLFSRRYGDAVRLEVADNCPQHFVDFLLEETGLGDTDLYRVNGPVNLARLMPVTDVNRPRLKWVPFIPGRGKGVPTEGTLFDALRERDILLHHPYESFSPVVDLIAQAARDPNVLAIKQTLYRTRNNSQIIQHLVEAARSGKEVTVVVELRARFDEENNINDATRLQEAGAIVVYGIVGYKTHAKMLMIVRREGEKLRRYFHLGTGNYHEGTARAYTDIGLLSSDEELGEDVHKIFLELTGLGRAAQLKHILHAPFTLQIGLKNLVEREIAHAQAGRPAGIRLKLNSLTDKELIQALYRASQAGVPVDIVVRGMCVLRPGIPGVSDNIRVRSIIGRFLEHARVYCFANGGETKVYCASADLMERNLYSRVEVCFPVRDPKLAKRVEEECLDLAFADNETAWMLRSDGTYERLARDEDMPAVDVQAELLSRLAR